MSKKGVPAFCDKCKDLTEYYITGYKAGEPIVICDSCYKKMDISDESFFSILESEHPGMFEYKKVNGKILNSISSFLLSYYP